MAKAAPTKNKSGSPAVDVISPLQRHSNTVMVIGVVVVMATLIIPLPNFLLDLLLACSITLALSVLIVTLSSKEALDLSTFPSLLLYVTLFRLSLNVASTRLILLHGSAGHIIETFGQFVAGGSVVIGLVIFLILVIIQFIVITKGSERISEVSARFTLDAMPGKQMAIDADLNAGMITETQANERRAKVVKESEFYGAMDGASKFIRGDAKAGLIITLINLVGGILMGYSHGMGISEAVATYSVLSIGDGLVSQIPSIIISVSSGFLVTKISSDLSVGEDMSKQFFQASRPLLVTSMIVGAMALVPGFPKPQFIVLAGIIFFLSRVAQGQETKESATPEAGSEAGPKKKKAEKEPEEFLEIDRVSVHVGVRLIGMVDPRKNNTIFERIGALRRKFVQDMGVVIPLVRLRDDINLEPNAYEIRLSELPVAKGHLETSMYLAMDPGTVQNKIKGTETIEPVYGLPALWITSDNKEEAELSGYTVIDPESVFMTHLAETLQSHADELLTREDTQQLVDRLRKGQPSLVGQAMGADGDVTMGLLQRVLRNLLKDRIPIREMTTILESLAENTSKSKNPAVLTELVRKSLARTITQQCKGQDGKIYALTFDPGFEHQMISALRQENGQLLLGLPSETVMALNRQIAQSWKRAMDMGMEKVVLLCDSRLRSNLAELISRTVRLLPVVAYDEIVLGTDINPIETIKVGAAEQMPEVSVQPLPVA